MKFHLHSYKVFESLFYDGKKTNYDTNELIAIKMKNHLSLMFTIFTSFETQNPTIKNTCCDSWIA